MFSTTITSQQFLQAFIETVQMVGISLFFGSLLGIPFGVLLVITRPGGVIENKVIYSILNPIINIVRSLPFIILLVAIVPFTRFVVHTSIGTSAAIIPLIIYIAPYIGRLVENSLLEVSPGIVEAAVGSLILSLTTATIGLIGATAMAGTVGGGGVGDLAIVYGYQRFDTVVVVATVIILIILVQGIQSLGNRLARKIRRY
jgi:D-methionine transport system permease protein